MSTENEKILNSLENIEEKLTYAEKVALWYDSTEYDKKIARKIIYEESGKQIPYADFLMYKLHMEDRNIPAAMDWLKRAYNKKYPEALAFTYFEYLYGYATFVTDAEARSSLFTAIEQNVPAAYYFLGYALYNLPFNTPEPKYPPNLHNEDERMLILADYLCSSQYEIDCNNARKCREETGESAYMKAKGLGFSEKAINWSCHEATVYGINAFLAYDLITSEVFTNSNKLLNHISNGTIQTYLNQRILKFNDKFQEYLETYRPMFNVQLIDINSSSKYCLYIELIENDHKFFRHLPIYYIAILDHSNTDDTYLFTGDPGYPHFDDDLHIDKGGNYFEIEGYSNNEMWMKKDRFKCFSPKESENSEPYRYKLRFSEKRRGNKEEKVEYFINQSIRLYKVTKKTFSEKLFNF